MDVSQCLTCEFGHWTKALECQWTTKLECYYSNKIDMFELYMPHEIVSFKEIENQKFKNSKTQKWRRDIKSRNPLNIESLYWSAMYFHNQEPWKVFFLAMTRPKSSQKATNGQDHLLSFNDMACHYIRAKFINPYERKW